MEIIVAEKRDMALSRSGNYSYTQIDCRNSMTLTVLQLQGLDLDWEDELFCRTDSQAELARASVPLDLGIPKLVMLPRHSE